MKKILTVLAAIALVAVWHLVMASPTQASGPSGYHGSNGYGHGYSGRGYQNRNNNYGQQYYKPAYQNRSLYGGYNYGGRYYSPGFTGKNSYGSSYHNQTQRNCYYPKVRVYRGSSNNYGHSNHRMPGSYYW